MKNPIGTDFEFVVISIEPKETPELAARKKEAYLNAYGRTEGNGGWHFLVGDYDQIAQPRLLCKASLQRRPLGFQPFIRLR